ncbi:MAG: hypothetical protein JWQ40_950 [Segetibacter sp.]|nr:hypothetical protein [Segetibacter sp.]
MVLHSGINIYSITHVQVDKAKEHFTVQLDKVNSSRTAPVLSELHVYTIDSTSYTMDEPHTIPFTNVAKVEVLGRD